MIIVYSNNCAKNKPEHFRCQENSAGVIKKLLNDMSYIKLTFI